MTDMPYGEISSEANGLRVTAALSEMLATLAELNVTLTEQQDLHGAPKADSPENILLLVTSKSVTALIDAVGVIGQVVALELLRPQG